MSLLTKVRARRQRKREIRAIQDAHEQWVYEHSLSVPENTIKEGVAADGAVPAGDAGESSDGVDSHDVEQTAPEAAPPMDLTGFENIVPVIRDEITRQLAELIAPRVAELMTAP